MPQSLRPDIIDNDYINEASAILAVLRIVSYDYFAQHPDKALAQHTQDDQIAKLADDDFMALVNRARDYITQHQRKCAQTVEERFIDPQSSHFLAEGTADRASYDNARRTNPRRIEKLNECAAILCTTQNAAEFKRAMNRSMILMRRKAWYELTKA